MSEYFTYNQKKNQRNKKTQNCCIYKMCHVERVFGYESMGWCACSTFNVFFIQVFKSFFLFCSFQFIWIAWKVKSRLKVPAFLFQYTRKRKSRHVYLFIFCLHFLNNCWDYNHNSAGMGGLKKYYRNWLKSVNLHKYRRYCWE